MLFSLTWLKWECSVTYYYNSKNWQGLWITIRIHKIWWIFYLKPKTLEISSHQEKLLWKNIISYEKGFLFVKLCFPFILYLWIRIRILNPNPRHWYFDWPYPRCCKLVWHGGCRSPADWLVPRFVPSTKIGELFPDKDKLFKEQRRREKNEDR